MPLANIICYCNECKGQVELPKDKAMLHASNRQGGPFSYELLSAMLAEVQDRGTRISTTTLSTKCLRSEVLLRTEPYTLDPKKGYASFRGTMFHGRLEQHAHPGALAEPRFHKLLSNGEWFSGSPDLVDVGMGYLYDYKFSKENPRFDYPWPDHTKQGQVNRWLCDHADFVEVQEELFPLTLLGLEHLRETYALDGITAEGLAENRARFVPVDWQGIYVVYMDDKGPKPILCTKSIDVPKKNPADGTKKARVADIWPDDVVEDFVLGQYAEVRNAFNLIEEDPTFVPPIPEDFAQWKHPLCEWCPVRESCINHFVDEVRAQGATHSQAAA